MYSATSELVRFWRSVGRRLRLRALLPWKLKSALPCKSLVPLLVTALITPPVAPPNSAV